MTVNASTLDVIGVSLLRAVTTNLNGAGIRVAQPEAYDNGTTNWEVNPANSLVQQPNSLFTYASNLGSTNNYPNTLNTESGHADLVAGNFYGVPAGVATNIAHVDNYDANYFINSIVGATFPTNINDPIVNQSFSFGALTTNNQQTVDSAYDDYSAEYKTLFISAVDNAGNVHAPGTSYNCIGVAAYGGSSSVGPTIDNGRAKPDITAPASETSLSTPQVAGAAAVLMQAGLRGDGGSDTNSAADIRTVKALLLNGAIKPADWTNNFPSPLDTRYGAGVLNVFNSYEQLTAGKHSFTVSTTVTGGGAHPPTGATGSVGAVSGWDFNVISTTFTTDTINHYYFNVTNATPDAAFTATATLVWSKQQNKAAINNLNLFLYNCANSNLVMCSTSLVDNVEHIFIPKLAQGRYDLQVWKPDQLNSVTISETYALVWEFFSSSANISKAGTNVNLSWPIYPAGFVVEATTNLVSPAWSTNNIPAPVVTNSQNSILLDTTNVSQFFRLRRP